MFAIARARGSCFRLSLRAVDALILPLGPEIPSTCQYVSLHTRGRETPLSSTAVLVFHLASKAVTSRSLLLATPSLL